MASMKAEIKDKAKGKAKTMKASIKAKVKAVTKKAKAAAKVVAKKAKAKCKGGKCCAALALLAVLCGCATSDSAQPAKSATMNNDFRDCIIIVATQASVSNGVVTADGTTDVPAVTLFQVAQNLENSGTDTISPSSTQTPTTDVKPDVDVSVPVNKAGAAQTLGSTLGDAAAAIIHGMGSSGSSSSDCTDGSCTAGGSCSGGSCSD